MPEQGSTPGIAPFISSKKYDGSLANIPITLPQNAKNHQIAISPVEAATVGTATVTIKPVGMTDFISLFEADGSTPVVLLMVGDARSDIRGSLQEINFALAGFDGTNVKVSVTSFF